MSNLINDGLAWLNNQRQAFLTSPYTYSRGSDSFPIQATRGQSTYTRKDKDGFSLKVTQTDFIVQAVDLVIGASPIKPKKGDRITDGVNTYEVNPGSGSHEWAYSGPCNVQIRIHTKQIS